MTLESRLVAAFEAVAADIKALWSVSAGGEGSSSPPLTLVASEALDAGNFVNIFTDAGAAKVRKASASLARSADGFVASSFPAGSLAVIKPLGEPHTHSSGLTPGREYWLGESGGISEFPPSANEIYAVAQTVGVAVNTSTIKTAEKFARVIGEDVIGLKQNLETIFGAELEAVAYLYNQDLTGAELQSWLQLPENSVAFSKICSSFGFNQLLLNPVTVQAMCESSAALDIIFGYPASRNSFTQSKALPPASIPVMTGNTTPSGVASASTSYSAQYGPWKAFDRIYTSEWASAQNSTTNQWVQYQFPHPVYIHTCELECSLYANNPGSRPKNFKIQCSDNGAEWADVFLGVHPYDPSMYRYYFPAPGKHAYWRVLFSDNYGGMLIQASTIQLLGFSW